MIFETPNGRRFLALAVAMLLTVFPDIALCASTKSPAVAVPAARPDTAASNGDVTRPVTSSLPQDAATANRPATQDWLKVCGPIPAGRPGAGQQSCIIRQVVVANNQFLGSFLLRSDPSQASPLLVVASVPLGVMLPFGLSWQIDNQKPIRVPYMLCNPQSCASQLVVNDQYVAALRNGHALNLTAKSHNKDLVVSIRLTGFGQVYDGKASVTFDELKKDTSGGAALQQLLQDRAEQLRKQLSDSKPAMAR